MDEEEKYRSSKEYANFLKETERKCGPDGFLDSRRYTHAFELHKNKQTRVNKSHSSTPRVIDVSSDRVKYEQEFERRLKSIEDSMCQAKQEERHLERCTRDVKKKQRDVRQMMKTWEQAIAKESFEEDKKLGKSLEKYTVLQRNYTHQKHDLAKSRADNLATMIHTDKDAGRKTQLNTSHLSRLYRDKMDRLHLSRLERDRLVREFETKLRKKEMEHIQLTKELEELSNDYYREALKGKTVKQSTASDLKRFRQNNINEDRTAEVKLESQLARGDGDVKAADMKKRRLSAQLSNTRSRIAIKKREDNRTLQSTRIKLQDNVDFQRKLNVDAKFATHDRQTKEIQHRIEEANARRINAANARLHQKKADRETQETMYNERAQERHLETLRTQHDDSLRHLRRCVSHGEGMEMQLHSKVKNAEYMRQKQEKEVRRLQMQLNNIQRQNSRHLTSEMAEANRREKELREQIIRAKADLDRAHAEREESYYNLLSHRSRLQDDKQMLNAHRAEDKRLSNIGQRSESVLAH